MIPHEGQGNGRAELLDSTILNTVLQHNQHFAFLFLLNFFCYISSFSLESTRVFDLIVPRWPRFPVHLVGLISSFFFFHPFSFVVRGNIIFTLFSSRPALFSFFFPFFLFHLVVCRRCDIGAETKQRWREVQIVVVVGCKKRRKKERK